ncbi:unnamed protein product [Blepharisma stoltei]|uniref:STIL N-terminal domain-containing protein n=1 Tax=Blepharisma stoltei TaxID=1481888 RepID=A0AAU9JWQ1_9CILI|nr:unnamed protein product [Blepharisma stoltei]
MDNFKDLTFNSAGPTVIIHGISLYASRGTLWPRTPIGKNIAVSVSSMLPVIKLTSEVLETLWIAGLQGSSRSALGGFLIGYKHSPAHFLNVDIKEIQWHVRKTPRNSGDYAIRVFPKDSERGDITRRESEFMLQSTLFKLDSYAELEFLEPLDLCKTSLNFDVRGNEIEISCQMLFPRLDLEFVPISPLKIVSTPLSVKLTQKNLKHPKFQTGYLTLDQKKRVLPLLCSDPLAFKYPLVGVWATASPGSQECPLSHPLIWSSCVRFIESKLIQERISPNPAQNTFLFIYFSSKPQFYEASTHKKAAWCIQNITHEIQKEGQFFSPITCKYLQAESPRISLTSPKLKQKSSNLLENSSIIDRFSNIETMPRSVRSSLETCNGIAQSTERLIREQSEMLKRLEKQIQNLQSHVISSRLETPRKSTRYAEECLSPKMVNSATNTTLSTAEGKIASPRLMDTKKSASTNTSFIVSHTERKLLPPRQARTKLSSDTESIDCKKISSDTESIDCKKTKQSPTRAASLRYSCSSTDISNIRSSINSNSSFQKSENSDTTIRVPKIIYESSLSDISDEEVAELEKKYLK